MILKEELKEILIKGMFSENLPSKVFTTTKIFENYQYFKINEIEKKFKESNSQSTQCFYISMYKTDDERRIISVPNIETYLILSNCILKNMELIYKKIDSSNASLSKIVSEYYNKVISSFEETLKKKVWTSLGNKYVASLDLSKCYENIYTHSISWALLSKEKAKEEYLKSDIEKSEEYIISDELDKNLRKINNNETKGIPTGPITSRLISELILAEVDNLLEKEGLKHNRYVDDYRFYFKTKEEAIQRMPQIQKILYEYKLSLNQSKTKIQIFPKGIFSENLKDEIGNYDFEKNNVIDFINKVMVLHNNGVKGAFKYGMKVLSQQNMNSLEKECVLPYLINLLVVFPKISDVIIDIFEKNHLIEEETKETLEKIEKIIDDLLKLNIDKGYDEEIIWNIYFMLKFNLEISKENILNILKRTENFSTIMILDYIFKKSLFKDKEIVQQIEILKEKLKKEDIYGEKWMLLYECTFNIWIKGIKKSFSQKYFWKELLDKKINFYNSPIS